MTRPPPLITEQAAVFHQNLRCGYFRNALPIGVLTGLAGASLIAIGFGQVATRWLWLTLAAVAIINLAHAFAVRQSEVFAILIFKGAIIALAGATLVGPLAAANLLPTPLLSAVLLLIGLAGSFLAVALAPMRGWLTTFAHGMVLGLIGLWGLLGTNASPQLLLIVFGYSLVLEGVWQIASARLNRRHLRATFLKQSAA